MNQEMAISILESNVNSKELSISIVKDIYIDFNREIKLLKEKNIIDIEAARAKSFNNGLECGGLR